MGRRGLVPEPNEKVPWVGWGGVGGCMQRQGEGKAHEAGCVKGGCGQAKL